MAKRTLLDISDDMQALDDLLQEIGGDLSDPAVEAAVDAFFNELSTDMGNKVDNYAALITMIRGRAKIRKDEARRLTDRVRVDERAADALADRLKYVFEKRGIQKMETARFRVSVANNGGLAPLLIDDGAEIPEAYQRVVREPDKTALRDALEKGVELDGVRLGQRGTSLRIK